MAQRQITINAYPLTECETNSFTVSLSFRDKAPSRQFGIGTVADCKAALQPCHRTRIVRQALAPFGPLRQTIRPQAARLRQGRQRPPARVPRQRASRTAAGGLDPPARLPFLLQGPRPPRAFPHLETRHDAAHEKPRRFQAPRQARRAVRPPLSRHKPHVENRHRRLHPKQRHRLCAERLSPAPELLARVAENPHRCGSWFWFPKAARCRFEDGEMIVLDQEGRPFIAFKPITPLSTHNQK